MQNYQCHITINNRASVDLVVDHEKVEWGEYLQAPANIPKKNGKKAFAARGVLGPAGTQGEVVYRLGEDRGATVSIKYDIPTKPWESNVVTVTTSNPDIIASTEGFTGSGATEACTIKVADIR